MRRVVLVAAILASVLLADQSTDALFRRAVDEQQRGDLESAIRDYQDLLKKDPGMVDARANLAAALAHLGRYGEAIREYRAALEKLPNEPTIRTNLGLAYYKAGDFASAAREFSGVLKLRPDDRRAATLLGDCDVRLGRHAEAIALLEPVAKEHPEDKDLAYVLASALLGRAKTLVAKQEFARARPDLDEALRLSPDVPGLYTLSGIVKEAASDEQGAEADLHKALERDPNDFQANLHLGGIFYGRRELGEARTYIERALAIDPQSPFAHYELALLESASGETAKAVEHLEKLERADPKWLEPHAQLAALYYKLHRPQDGLRERQIVEHLSSDQGKR